MGRVKLLIARKDAAGGLGDVWSTEALADLAEQLRALPENRRVVTSNFDPSKPVGRLVDVEEDDDGVYGIVDTPYLDEPVGQLSFGVLRPSAEIVELTHALDAAIPAESDEPEPR